MGIETAIRNGEYDSSLASITLAIEARSRVLLSASGGVKVRFKDTVSPKYLQGVEGVIVDKRTKNYVVDIGRKIGRFGPRIVSSDRLFDRV